MPCVQVTYPLDTLRLRIAVDPSMRGIRGASAALFREGSYSAFFRGLTASLIGTLPQSLLLCCVCMGCVVTVNYCDPPPTPSLPQLFDSKNVCFQRKAVTKPSYLHFAQDRPLIMPCLTQFHTPMH